MAKEFGWTLDYIDSLPLSVMEEYRDFGAVMDGAQKAHNFLRRQSTPSHPKRKR